MKISSISEHQIPGVKLINFERFMDQRGFFTETFRSSDFINNHHELSVQNTGQLGNYPNSNGFGLKSTEDRLNLLYQGKASFAIKNMNNEMVESRITMPFIAN